MVRGINDDDIRVKMMHFPMPKRPPQTGKGARGVAKTAQKNLVKIHQSALETVKRTETTAQKAGLTVKKTIAGAIKTGEKVANIALLASLL
jgi:hypothetical protein